MRSGTQWIGSVKLTRGNIVVRDNGVYTQCNIANSCVMHYRQQQRGTVVSLLVHDYNAIKCSCSSKRCPNCTNGSTAFFSSPEHSCPIPNFLSLGAKYTGPAQFMVALGGASIAPATRLEGFCNKASPQGSAAYAVQRWSCKAVVGVGESTRATTSPDPR